MGSLVGLLTGWFESGGVRFKRGTKVRIAGAYEVSAPFAGRVGTVAGLAAERWGYQTRFLVDLGGMQVEVPPADLDLVSE